jgi:hypothetical protein
MSFDQGPGGLINLCCAYFYAFSYRGHLPQPLEAATEKLSRKPADSLCRWSAGMCQSKVGSVRFA